MRRLRTFTAISAVAVLAALVTPGTASAAAPSHGRLLATVNPSAFRPAARGPAAPAAIAMSADPTSVCTPTPAGSPERKAGGVMLCVHPEAKGSSDGVAEGTAGDATMFPMD